VVDRLLNVACAMLRHGTLFNPEAAQTLPSTTKFKIDTVTQNRLAKRWGVPSKTATFETRSIPPAFVRRISYPTAAGIRLEVEVQAKLVLIESWSPDTLCACGAAPDR